VIRLTGHYRAMRDGDNRADWSTRFARTVAEEIRSGVQSGALTWGEADQLLARMHILVEQALDLGLQPVA
jgi:hypothetical protein